MARNILSAGGHNRAVVQVEQLGYELYGKDVFDLAKEANRERPAHKDRVEALEKAVFYVLAAWAEYDDAKETNGCEKLVALGHLGFGKQKWEEAMVEFLKE